jgi:hypothetical protein
MDRQDRQDRRDRRGLGGVLPPEPPALYTAMMMKKATTSTLMLSLPLQSTQIKLT